MRSATVGIVATALMMTSSATASAQTVRACVNVSNGQFSLMSDSGCSTKEESIEWNVQGPRGLQGPPGPAGPQGPGGPQGTPGTNGAPGQNGAQGPAGPQGSKGLEGAQGAQGLVGMQGTQGLEGAVGARGPAGLDGAAGKDGQPGPAGPQGSQGLEGVQGAQGPVGVQGTQGLEGAVGARGPAGLDGAAGQDGQPGPPGADGRPADQGGLLVVDAAGQEVGSVTDVYNGYVVRRAGNDMVWFVAPNSGLPVAPTIFFHSEPDCGGQRYLQTMGGQALAYFARVHRGVLFYTKTSDPWGEIAIGVQSYELIPPTEDATLPARQCVPYDGRASSLGEVTTAFDPALASLIPPFRIK